MSDLALATARPQEAAEFISLRDLMNRLRGEFDFVSDLAMQMDGAGGACATDRLDADTIRSLQNVDLIVQSTLEYRDILGRIAGMIDAHLLLPVEPLVSPIKLDGIKQRLSAATCRRDTSGPVSSDVEIF